MNVADLLAVLLAGAALFGWAAERHRPGSVAHGDYWACASAAVGTAVVAGVVLHLAGRLPEAGLVGACALLTGALVMLGLSAHRLRQGDPAARAAWTLSALAAVMATAMIAVDMLGDL